MAVLLPEGKQSFETNDGHPLVGGRLYTYEAGTSTPKPTYSDSSATVPNTNPIILDARGEATIFWDGSYKVILKDAADVTIWTVDGVGTGNIGVPVVVGNLKIAVIGDSTSAQNPMTDEGWPQILQRVLSQSGQPSTVVDCSMGGNTCWRAMNVLQFGGTETPAQRAVASAPDIVLVRLNYVMGLVPSSTLPGEPTTIGDQESAVFALFSYLRTELPSAKIVYESQLCYDSANFITSTLKNKGVVPYYFTLQTTGILANNYCAEMLEDAASATVKGYYANWISLDSYTKSLSSSLIDGYYSVNYWQLHRMGMGGRDGLHLFQFGNYLLAAAATAGLRTLSFFSTYFPTLTNKLNTVAEDPALFWAGIMTASGDGWVWNNVFPSGVSNMNAQWGFNPAFNPDSWLYPSKGKFKIDANFPGYSYNPSYWDVRNGPPNSEAYYSIDGAAWIDAGVATDPSGYGSKLTNGRTPVMTAGAHTIRFKIGNEVYGGYAVTANMPSVPTLAARFTGSLTLATSSLYTILFDTEDVDTASAYAPATGIFTVPAAGMYHLSTQIRFSTTTAGTIFVVGIALNGATGTERICENAGIVPTTSVDFCASCSRIANLAAGDTIRVHVSISSGVAPKVISGASAWSGATMLNIVRIGD